jgi:hypothetical protein
VEKLKEYERARLELLYFEATDVIATSESAEGDEDSFGWA